MKYSKKDTVLCGWLTPGTDVTVKLVNTHTDTLVAASSYECIESTVVPGLYMYDTAKITENSIHIEIAYIMESSDGDTYGGKVVIDKNLEPVNIGNWEMINNQMVMYNLQGDEIARYNLFNSRNEPSLSGVTKREILNV